MIIMYTFCVFMVRFFFISGIGVSLFCSGAPWIVSPLFGLFIIIIVCPVPSPECNLIGLINPGTLQREGAYCG